LHRLERKPEIPNSSLYLNLSPFRIELILYMMAATSQEAVKRLISNYFTQVRCIKPFIGGKDLMEMGLSPGPVFKEILQAVLEAKLNAKLKTKADELEFARSLIR
jgi:tRNA nucleotidyltransferase (CCA-adding enzyme)